MNRKLWNGKNTYIPETSGVKRMFLETLDHTWRPTSYFAKKTRYYRGTVLRYLKNLAVNGKIECRRSPSNKNRLEWRRIQHSDE